MLLIALINRERRRDGNSADKTQHEHDRLHCKDQVVPSSISRDTKQSIYSCPSLQTWINDQWGDLAPRYGSVQLRVW